MAQIEQFLEDARHCAGIRVGEFEDANVLTAAGRAVEILDHPLDQLHGLARRAHDHGVGTDIGRERNRLPSRRRKLHLNLIALDAFDLLEVLQHRRLLTSTSRERIAREHILNQRNRLLHIRALQRDVLDLHHTLRRGTIELRDESTNRRDIGFGPTGDDRVETRIGRNLNRVRAASTILFADIHLIEHANHVRRRGLGQHKNFKRLVRELILRCLG